MNWHARLFAPTDRRVSVWREVARRALTHNRYFTAESDGKMLLSGRVHASGVYTHKPAFYRAICGFWKAPPSSNNTHPSAAICVCANLYMKSSLCVGKAGQVLPIRVYAKTIATPWCCGEHKMFAKFAILSAWRREIEFWRKGSKKTAAACCALGTQKICYEERDVRWWKFDMPILIMWYWLTCGGRWRYHKTNDWNNKADVS